MTFINKSKKNNFINTNELKLLCTNVKINTFNQQFYKFSTKNLRQNLKKSIYCNLNIIINSFIVFKFIDQNLKQIKMKSFVLLLDNKIYYYKYQLNNINTLNYYNNLKLLYIFFNQLLKILALAIILKIIKHEIFLY